MGSNLENFRIEHDLLGEKLVPKDAYYGIHTVRAVENFTISQNKISDNIFMVNLQNFFKIQSCLI